MIIDSHCHLDYFPKHEIPDIIERARQAQVKVLHTISTKLSEIDKILDIVSQYDNVYASIGIHPNEVSDEDPINVAACIKMTQHHKIISIGETGLDYYYGKDSMGLQKQSFIKHIEIARETDLPLVIHSRNADDDMIEILEQEYRKGKFKAIMHSFASSKKLCEAALALDFYISFSGIVTFKNAKNIQDTALIVPDDRLLVETDAPYLAPTPHRGKRNEPAFIQHTVQYLSTLRECDNLANITTQNFCHLFNLEHHL